ncbi:transposable element Tcb1 transposase [Trichonephila inaurata madagascariensis]|uniref:Transposable element Tcb1 transposase n=1 Tax=Trichonephila inaurata madagascariensis TaxID=2747483 RepID=A0A8X6YHX6_9ARAC|nr:transposable element Tcb1 transposase [Trichonephila inaurata madagascariensis]
MRGNVLNKSRCGHPHKLSDRDARAINSSIRRLQWQSFQQNRSSHLEPTEETDFASPHVDKDFDFWKTVVFTDESKFNVFRSDGRGKVWRKKTAVNPENLTPTVKHGGGSVMVWDAMAATEVGNLVFIDGT